MLGGWSRLSCEWAVEDRNSFPFSDRIVHGQHHKTRHRFSFVCIDLIENIFFLHFSLNILFFFLLHKQCSHKTPKLRFVLLRVSLFYTINLCNARFIAFLCNHSVIRLSSVQFFMVNSVLHCILPLICQVLLPVSHQTSEQWHCSALFYHFKARGFKVSRLLYVYGWEC